MSRLTQRIETMYRKIFDEHVPPLPSLPREWPPVDEEFEDLIAAVTTLQAEGAR